MNTWIILLRGINVGGSNVLPMADLKATLLAAGFESVQTYIQSGNVVLVTQLEDANEIESSVNKAIQHSHGMNVAVWSLSASALARAVAANPFHEAGAVPKTLHLFFLQELPTPARMSVLEGYLAPTEQLEVNGNHIYLHAPEGIGRSRVAQKLESTLGISATARNWRTVLKLCEMVDRVD